VADNSVMVIAFKAVDASPKEGWPFCSKRSTFFFKRVDLF